LNLNLENKVAIMIGASAGIGKAIALNLAKEGGNVNGAESDILSPAWVSSSENSFKDFRQARSKRILP
jgi:NAD(P)-dependent dehydrogenase (short-subunit alcohol dehydrogenase family)